MIIILDYNVGNLSAIRNMLKRCGTTAIISADPKDIENGTKFILPGVGSFDHGISNLRSADYFPILKKKVLQERSPILGICLGAQLLAGSSEEGDLPGLNWIEGKVVRFKKEEMDNDLKIPHMGWADVQGFENSKLFTGMYQEPRFYFVHSYHLQLDSSADTLASANYGYDFAVGIEHENILGVQFHPEKSHKFGMKLLENFVKYY